MHAEFPANIAALILGCKKPTVRGGTWAPCGKCIIGCKYNGVIEEKLAGGYTPATIFDYWRSPVQC